MNDRWIAFLRAINTGNRRVKGDRLVSVFEACGFDDVSSFQASGMYSSATLLQMWLYGQEAGLPYLRGCLAHAQSLLKTSISWSVWRGVPTLMRTWSFRRGVR